MPRNAAFHLGLHCLPKYTSGGGKGGGLQRVFVCLFDLILYIPVNNFSVLCRDGSSRVEPVLSKVKCVLLKDYPKR